MEEQSKDYSKMVSVMADILNTLRAFPSEVLEYYILKLMEEEKISFASIAAAHTMYLDGLKKGQTEKLIQLRSKVIDLWTGNKKDIGKNLVSLMQEAKDNGWANINQEQIDNSKWNR